MSNKTKNPPTVVPDVDASGTAPSINSDPNPELHVPDTTDTSDTPDSLPATAPLISANSLHVPDTTDTSDASDTPDSSPAADLLVSAESPHVPDATDTSDTPDSLPDEEIQEGPEIYEDQLESELGNAQRFKYYFQSILAYCLLIKTWFRWDGTRWARTDPEELKPYVVMMFKLIRAVEIPWLEHRYGLEAILPKMKWYVSLFNGAAISAVIKLSASIMRLKHPLDMKPHFLNVENGTLDLKTSELLKHDRGHYLTTKAPVQYVNDSKCPEFHRVLRDMFPDNPDGIRYLQKWLGYALTGLTVEKRLCVFWGATGNNGKTLLVLLLRALLGGDFCKQVSATSLMAGHKSLIRSDVMSLDKVRFATTSETDKAMAFDEPTIKLFTGGDVITGRDLREKQKEFIPEFKLFIITNFPCLFNADDQALQERMDVIPFDVCIPPAKRDGKLLTRLLANEKEGIFAWLVEGANLWYRDGLGKNPFKVANKTAKAIVVRPTVKRFLAEYCDTSFKVRDEYTPTKTLLNAYHGYQLRMEDLDPSMTLTAFGLELTAEGYKTTAVDKTVDGVRTSIVVRYRIVLNTRGLALLKKASNPVGDAEAEGYILDADEVSLVVATEKTPEMADDQKLAASE